MTVQFLSNSAIYDGATRTVRVAAVEQNKLIVCAITRDVIVERFLTEPCSAKQVIELYWRHRKSFHLLALFKYRTRRIERDGTVLVTADDVPVLSED
jgi:hypothetical protein